jgi:hypothetical protein
MKTIVEENKTFRKVLQKLNATLQDSKVAFQCTINGFYVTGSVIPCGSIDVNLGNAMSSAGTFIAPIDGIYMFTFSGWTESDDELTDVRLRADDKDIGRVIVKDEWGAETENERLSISIQAIVDLTAGQRVDSYLDGGYLGTWVNNHVSTFTGHLLFPM